MKVGQDHNPSQQGTFCEALPDFQSQMILEEPDHNLRLVLQAYHLEGCC